MSTAVLARRMKSLRRATRSADFEQPRAWLLGYKECQLTDGKVHHLVGFGEEGRGGMGWEEGGGERKREEKIVDLDKGSIR